jgi:hypothetical protein
MPFQATHQAWLTSSDLNDRLDSVDDFFENLGNRGEGPRVYWLRGTMTGEVCRKKLAGIAAEEVDIDKWGWHKNVLWSCGFASCQAILGYYSDPEQGFLHHRLSVVQNHKHYVKLIQRWLTNPEWVLLTGRTSFAAENTSRKQEATEARMKSYCTEQFGSVQFHRVLLPFADSYGVIFDVRGWRVLVFTS